MGVRHSECRTNPNRNGDATMTPDSSYRTIPLDKGCVAIVSNRDYHWLNQWSWFAMEMRSGSFYAARSTWDGTHVIRVLMHREILGLKYRDGKLGDHHNLDTLDNRRNNLRVATHRDNILNTPLRADNTSGCKGVYFYPERNKWYVRISVGGRVVSLGYFVNKTDAIAARLGAAKKHYGEFGREK